MTSIYYHWLPKNYGWWETAALVNMKMTWTVIVLAFLATKQEKRPKIEKKHDDKKEFRKRALTFKNEVKKCEERLEKLQIMKRKVADILSNQDLYSNDKLKELENWNKKYSEINEAIKRAEDLWIQAQEKLENFILSAD